MEDYKEKYEQALNRAKVINPGTADYEVAVKIFPELKKNDDEKIKEEIKVILANTDLSQFALDYTFADMINWLEKQGKQKSAKWSDYDECMLTNLIEDTRFGIDIEYIDIEYIDWLKSLKQRMKGE